MGGTSHWAKPLPMIYGGYTDGRLWVNSNPQDLAGTNSECAPAVAAAGAPPSGAQHTNPAKRIALQRDNMGYPIFP